MLLIEDEIKSLAHKRDSLALAQEVKENRLIGIRLIVDIAGGVRKFISEPSRSVRKDIIPLFLHTNAKPFTMLSSQLKESICITLDGLFHSTL